ncbi:MAG: baseplate J/gp47 family protein, partial [Synechococcales bacterium]|nr:baseplate J/gp47 family protein [Synechococcales bacterium]
MGLPLPNLDDRTYADLVEEAIALIPVEAPEWTDHNPSDTGIVLIELLAWLTEMVLYRVNQIPDRNQAAFLSLLQGAPWSLPEGKSTTEQTALLQAEIQKTLTQLRRPHRAVTAKDFEQLILSDWLKTRTAQQEFGADGVIARVNCLPERDLENSDINQIVEGHISLVVLPRSSNANSENLRNTIKKFLDQRRLISTRLHVVEPGYVKVKISATLYLYDSANFQTVQAEANQRLQAFFAPLNSQNYWQGQGY